MSAIIAILSDKTVISWSKTLWEEEGTYVNPLFWNVLFDCPEDKQLDTDKPLGDMGEPVSHTFETMIGSINCDQCYIPDISQIPLKDLLIEGVS